jgi:hypothetical protein
MLDIVYCLKNIWYDVSGSGFSPIFGWLFIVLTGLLLYDFFMIISGDGWGRTHDFGGLVIVLAY